VRRVTELLSLGASAAPIAMNENIFKRLRWIMVGAIVLDATHTLWGQPRTYWSDPSTSNEHNTFVRFFAHLGYPLFILYWVVYGAAAFFIVSRVPRRFAPIAIFTFILPHYFGATSWWVYTWGYGQSVATISGFVLAVVLGVALISRGKGSNSQ
jgi:hypothetical protein